MAEAMLSQARVLQRGWSVAMVREFLGEPDDFRRNPHYRRASPMRMYRQARVEDAERTAAFAERMALRKSRAEKGKAAAERQRRETLELARSVEIQVEWPRSWTAARKAGLQHWQENNWERGGDGDGRGADAATLDRWASNWIRHCRTSYGYVLFGFRGAVGTGDAYVIIRERVDAMIAEWRHSQGTANNGRKERDP